MRDPGSATNKGYGFFEYMDQSLTDVACQGLNGLQLGDRVLTVRRASAQDGEMYPVSFQAVQPIIDLQSAVLNPTKVLCLSNMVTLEELEEEEDYEDILEDVREECSKFGKLLTVVIPRPNSAGAVSGLGKVFLEYSSLDESQAASQVLNGRKFSGRVVQTFFIDEEKFAKREF